MIQKKPRKVRPEYLKTQTSPQAQLTLMEFGKPVRLPNIHKKIHRYQKDMANSRSIEARNSSSHNQSLISKIDSLNAPEHIALRKYSNNSQLHLLTLEEMQLCSQRSKKFLPKITGLANCFTSTRQNTDYFDREQFMHRLSRMKSEKRIQTNTHEQLNNYKFDIIIGRGSYSIVKLAYHSSNKKYAVKIYSKNKVSTPERKANLQRQIMIMKDIDHPNIIKFKQQIQTEDKIFLFMELFDNCSLSDYIKKNNASSKVTEKRFGDSKLNDYRGQRNRNTILTKKNQLNVRSKNQRSKNKLSQSVAKYIFKQIIESIYYLHKVKNIVHRDIKLDNILIQATQMRIKIIDFGFSCYDNDSVWHEDYCGTPNYISPQILKKQGYQGKPADIWALGVLLYYFVVGSYPFKSPSQNSDFTKFQEKLQESLSAELKHLLSRMLQNNPNNRYSAEQILNSEWLKQK